MAKYDNTKEWDEYRGKNLNKFIDEFREKLNSGRGSIGKLKSLLDGCNFKEACMWIELHQNEPEPLEKLRSRFRTYSYKKRNHLTNMTVSKGIKTKLDKVMNKLGYEDYSDVIDALLKTSKDEEVCDALGLLDKTKDRRKSKDRRKAVR